MLEHYVSSQVSPDDISGPKRLMVLLYLRQLFFEGLITTIFVDILKVGSVDEAVW